MTLQFPIPQFIGQAVTYGGQVWIWDGVAYAIDDVASRLDLATVPAYEGQFVYRITGAPASFISLGTPDLFGATFTLSTTPPFEGVKAYVNGSLLTPDDGSGTIGDYTVDRATNRVVFQSPVAVNSEVVIGVLTPSDNLAPGRVDVVPIKDLSIDWTAIPPTGGMVNGVRTQFSLFWDRPGVGQQAAVISANEALAVVQNGRRLQPGIDYTVTGSTLTMTVAPPAGQAFWALWYRPGGTSGGTGVEPPQPPQDAQSRYYGWLPGTGLSWADARGVAVSLPNAAARTALRADIDRIAGKLVLQADTQDLWLAGTGTNWARFLDGGTITTRGPGRVQTLRSTTALQRPAAASLLPGEIYVNLADREIGIGDDSGNPVDLIRRIITSAGAADASKIPALGAQGTLDASFFVAGLRPYGTVNPGAIVITDWNNAHLNGTTVVRAAAGTPNRPPGPDLAYAGTYISMGDANTGVLTAASPTGDTVYVRPRNAGNWGAWIQVNSPGLDISSAMLRANNLSDVASKPTGRTNLEVLFNPRTVYVGDLNVLDETGLYPLGIGVTNGWVADGTGAGSEAGAGDAVLHVETGGSLAFQLGFNLRQSSPAARPLRVRFMTGPTTWTPWASIQTSDEVSAAIAAAVTVFGFGTQTPDKDANATGLVTEFFRANAGSGPDATNWHLLMMSKSPNVQGAQIAVQDRNTTDRGRLAFRQRSSTGVWSTWTEAQPILSVPTASRPTVDRVPGLMIFDTTLGRPVWRNAANNAWVDLLDQVPPGTTVGDTPPASPQPGQLWFRTLAPVGLYVWVNDGDSSQWVQTQGGGNFLQAGRQNVPATGLLSANLDQVPVGFSELAILFNVITPANAVINFDFAGTVGAQYAHTRGVLSGTTAATAGGDADTTYPIDAGNPVSSTYMGTLFLNRFDSQAFMVSGNLRRGNTVIFSYAGRCILNNPAGAHFPRVNCNLGGFTGGTIAGSWKM